MQRSRSRSSISIHFPALSRPPHLAALRSLLAAPLALALRIAPPLRQPARKQEARGAGHDQDEDADWPEIHHAASSSEHAHDIGRLEAQVRRLALARAAGAG